SCTAQAMAASSNGKASSDACPARVRTSSACSRVITPARLLWASGPPPSVGNMTRQTPRREGEQVEADRRIPQRGTARSDLRGGAAQSFTLAGAHRLQRRFQAAPALYLDHRQHAAAQGEEVDHTLPRGQPKAKNAIALGHQPYR